MPRVTLPFTGALEPDEDYDEIGFAGLDLSGAKGAGSRFLDCVMQGCDLTGADLARSRWTESELTEVRGVGTPLSDANLLDVTVTDARLGAISAYGSTWRSVTIRGGKAGAKLRSVDLSEARLVDPRA